MGFGSTANTANPDDLPGAIMRLNYDCVEHIMHHLSAGDRFSLALTCRRLFDFYRQMSSTLDKSINFQDFKGTQKRLFFKYFHPFGFNVTSLRITHKRLTKDNMSKMFPYLNQLEDLQLTYCSLIDNQLLELSQLQLKKLDLSYNNELTGVNMNRLPATIECLDIKCCSQVRSNLLPSICKALPRLKELNTYGIYIKSIDFKKFVENKCCDSLENIVIGARADDDQYEYLAMLPNLKKILLFCERNSQVRSELLYLLIERNPYQIVHFRTTGKNSINAVMMLLIAKLVGLRSLVLPNNDWIKDNDLISLSTLQELHTIDLTGCSTISDNAVLQLIIKCPKLQVLNLTRCTKITDMLLYNIADHLDKLNSNRPVPITIIVYETKITKSLVTTLNDGIRLKLQFKPGNRSLAKIREKRSQSSDNNN